MRPDRRLKSELAANIVHYLVNVGLVVKLDGKYPAGVYPHVHLQEVEGICSGAYLREGSTLNRELPGDKISDLRLELSDLIISGLSAEPSLPTEPLLVYASGTVWSDVLNASIMGYKIEKK